MHPLFNGDRTSLDLVRLWLLFLGVLDHDFVLIDFGLVLFFSGRLVKFVLGYRLFFDAFGEKVDGERRCETGVLGDQSLDGFFFEVFQRFLFENKPLTS